MLESLVFLQPEDPLDSFLFIDCQEKTDQNKEMCREILVFNGQTHRVNFIGLDKSGYIHFLFSTKTYDVGTH